MSDTPYEKLLIKIDKMTTLTRAGVLQWEKVLHRDCIYKVIGMSPRIAITCLQSECSIEAGTNYCRVRSDDLATLHGAIAQQIRWREEEVSNVVKLLHVVLSPTSIIIEQEQ